MKKTLFAALIWIAILQGEIREMAHFNIPLEETSNPEETLVLCDIDNTLIRASQYLGSVQWSEDLKTKLERGGMSEKEVKQLESVLWQSVQPHVSVELVDLETPGVIKSLQNKNVRVLGLTARSPEEADYSARQLSSLDIDLQSPFFKDNQSLSLETAALYKNGILFSTPLNKKSEVLLAFLEKNRLLFKRIIFIDDKLHHVQDVVDAAERRGISCLGIWLNP
jgi:hypothetical protein